ncbi:hypothetical protein EYC84_009862 [Monilinia fructicola]|uniref:Uncharacterized protein n=1 Tax=Monilinia fructicola TaxID=38448 RepID=A0A5M9JG11_MONFR|nr:hypothetical protein EYC84_009862 [Monilinia fructicola]
MSSSPSPYSTSKTTPLIEIHNPTPEDKKILHEKQPQQIQDPGDQWLPKILNDKSKHDLASALSNPNLLAALTHSTSTAHPIHFHITRTIKIGIK